MVVVVVVVVVVLMMMMMMMMMMMDDFTTLALCQPAAATIPPLPHPATSMKPSIKLY